MNCEYYKYKINLFNLILDKLVTIDNTDIFSGDILLSAFKTSFKHYYKFKVFNDMILNNLFVSDNKKEEFITIFSNVQNIFYKFKKIYYIYCYNKTQVNESIKYDLHFNDLSIYKNKNKIQFIESNTINTFVVSDLLKLISISLIHSDNIFSFPLAPKNPYTNIELSYHNLYNLYIYCKENNFIIPQAFLYYFYSDFNIEKLKLSYEPFFREKAIKSFHDNLTYNSKVEYIKDILQKFKNIIPLKINRNFPFSKVVEKLEHVIIYYLRVNYSLQPAIVLHNKGKLETTLFKFYKENKYFGTILENNSNFNIQTTDSPFIFGLPRNNILENSNNNNNRLQNNNSPFIFGSTRNTTSVINNNNISTTTTINNNNNNNNNIITVINNMPINNNFDQLIQIATQQYNSINNDNSNQMLFDNPNIRNNIFNIINQNNVDDLSNNNISINDISNNFINSQIDRLRSEEDQLIINNQIRIREMLAGDDYEYSDIDTDYDGYTD